MPLITIHLGRDEPGVPLEVAPSRTRVQFRRYSGGTLGAPQLVDCAAGTGVASLEPGFYEVFPRWRTRARFIQVTGDALLHQVPTVEPTAPGTPSPLATPNISRSRWQQRQPQELS